ncbi:MAG: hypothetical protein JST08_01190 [Actinobacteria bacterium]|nr:hypothetical protein [Actinomycetota bacterium]
MNQELAPQRDECSVLSVLAVRDGDSWCAVSGSLVSLPVEAGAMSWLEWESRQPQTGRPRAEIRDDLGPEFDEEPFAGLRIIRKVILREEWRPRVEEIESGRLGSPDGSIAFSFEEFSATKLLAQDGQSDAHRVLDAVRRPIRGVSAALRSPELPHSEDFWLRGGPIKPSGQHTREELLGKESFHNWPSRLLGIRWLGTTEFPPPACFVIGKAQGGIWIADMLPDWENGQIEIVLAWEAEEVDPLSCSILLRSEREDASLLHRSWKVSDLPGEIAQGASRRDPRELAWNERTIGVKLPRGPRRTEFGVMLFGPDGALRDERPVGPRIEQIELSVGIMDAPDPFSASLIGDPENPPSEAVRDRQAAEARREEEQAREVAAGRRLTTTGDLRRYLHWRFSVRAGELLILDRYLLDLKSDEGLEGMFAFLAEFGRPVRALVSRGREAAKEMLADKEWLEVRRTSPKLFHDRLWITGETAVLVGTSINKFLEEGAVPATCAIDLPYGDGIAWREKFREWWRDAEPLG